jgi:hypothetical protein
LSEIRGGRGWRIHDWVGRSNNVSATGRWLETGGTRAGNEVGCVKRVIGCSNSKMVRLSCPLCKSQPSESDAIHGVRASKRSTIWLYSSVVSAEQVDSWTANPGKAPVEEQRYDWPNKPLHPGTITFAGGGGQAWE